MAVCTGELGLFISVLPRWTGGARLRPLHQSFHTNDGAGVLTFANFATRIEGPDLEPVEFAFHAEERGLGGNLGVIGGPQYA